MGNKKAKFKLPCVTGKFLRKEKDEFMLLIFSRKLTASLCLCYSNLCEDLCVQFASCMHFKSSNPRAPPRGWVIELLKMFILRRSDPTRNITCSANSIACSLTSRQSIQYPTAVTVLAYAMEAPTTHATPWNLLPSSPCPHHHPISNVALHTPGIGVPVPGMAEAAVLHLHHHHQHCFLQLHAPPPRGSSETRRSQPEAGRRLQGRP